MKIIRVNHLGIVPKNSESSLHFFKDILKIPYAGEERVEDQGVNVQFLELGETRLELLSPTHEESPIQKFLQTRGSGIQHLALEVDSLEEWLVHLKEKGIKVIDEKPRLGAHHTLIAFIHPSSTGGILVELVQQQ